MGLDASVRCRCWEEGLCKPTRLLPHIRFVPEEDRLDIDLPWDGHEKDILEFDRWCLHCCPHPSMHQVSEWISNWSGVRVFQNALRTAGKDRFRQLLTEIPNVNGGLTQPAMARVCLGELDAFDALGEFGRRVVLSDRETGAPVVERVESYNGQFVWDGRTGHDFFLDPDGHLQIRHKHAGVVFRSRAFSQAELAEGKCVYTDLASGISYAVPGGIKAFEASRYPAVLEGVVTSDHAGNYAYMVSALRRVFMASLSIGHPVAWG